MIQSVDRAIMILLELEGARRLGVSELATRLGLAKATVHGLLRTLTRRGMVSQDPETGKYSLGPTTLRMGNIYLETSDLRARSLRWADDLAQRTGQAVRVGVLITPEVMVIHHVFRPDGSTQISEVGVTIPAHVSALGKVLMAFNPDEADVVLTGPLRRLTGSTVTDGGALRRELDRVAERAVGMERDEAVLGESAVAAPIFTASGRTVGAVGVVCPTARLDQGSDDLVETVREVARAISRELGASSWPVHRPTP